MAIITCEKCNGKFNIGGNSDLSKITECPECGSEELNGYVFLTDTINKFHEMIKTKAGKGSEGKPFREKLSGDDYYYDKEKWVKKTRLIDRENNKYYELITDPDTGEVIHEKEEPLTEHQGHGSAKEKEST